MRERERKGEREGETERERGRETERERERERERECVTTDPSLEVSSRTSFLFPGTSPFDGFVFSNLGVSHLFISWDEMRSNLYSGYRIAFDYK